MASPFYFFPESSFSPLNRLEELLIASDSDSLPPESMNDLYNTLLESELSVIMFTSARVEDLREQIELYGAVQDAHIEFPVNSDGNLYVFSARERAQLYIESAPEPPAGMKQILLTTPGVELVTKVMGETREMVITGLMLNPYYPYCTIFPVDIVLAAAQHYAMSGDLRALLRSPVSLRLTALPDRHQPLANAIHNFCTQRPDVLAAYAGLVQLVTTKPPKPFVWYYTARRRPLYDDSLEAIAHRLYHARNAVLIHPATAASPSPFSSPAELAVYFSGFSLAPIYQRV